MGVPMILLLLAMRVAWPRLARACAPLLGACVLGAASGALARRADGTTCAARLEPGNHRLHLRVHDPVEPDGGRGQARPMGRGCGGLVTVRWSRGPGLAAGAVVEVEAHWRPHPARFAPAGGTLVVLRRRSDGHAAGPADRWRTRVHQEAVARFGARAPLVHALVLGRRDLDRPLRDAFARSGLAHLLAISGFHVGLVGGWVVLLLAAAGVTRRARLLAAAGAVCAYALFLGLPPPATRAAAATLLVVVERLRGRAVRRGDLLSACVLVLLLLDPWTVVSVGAWLSCLAAAGVLMASGWASSRLPGAPWAVPLAVSIGATAATAPVLALAFGAVPVAGVGLNLVAVPLTALTLPSVLAALGLGTLGLSVVADGFAAAGGLGLGALETIARWGSELPHAALPIGHEPWAVGAAALPLAALAWLVRGRVTAREAGRRLAWAVALASVALLVPRGFDPGFPGLALHFLDVGQGDAAAIRTPAGHWIVVDAGPADERLDAGAAVVVPYLRRHGARRLAAAVVSHAHADHLGGMASTVAALDPPLVLEPGVPVADAGYLRFLGEVLGAGVRWVPARPGTTLVLDGVRLTVLHPDPGAAGFGTDLNEDSVVLLVEFGCFRALLTGDAGFAAEAALAGRVGRVAVLKVGHHGSRTATGAGLLDEARPQVAVVSSGRSNRYGHPSPEALGRIAAAGATLWRTDTEGAVRVTTDGSQMTVAAARGARTLTTRLACSPAPASPPSRASSSPASRSIPRRAGN